MELSSLVAKEGVHFPVAQFPLVEVESVPSFPPPSSWLSCETIACCLIEAMSVGVWYPRMELLLSVWVLWLGGWKHLATQWER